MFHHFFIPTNHGVSDLVTNKKPVLFCFVFVFRDFPYFFVLSLTFSNFLQLSQTFSNFLSKPVLLVLQMLQVVVLLLFVLINIFVLLSNVFILSLTFSYFLHLSSTFSNPRESLWPTRQSDFRTFVHPSMQSSPNNVETKTLDIGSLSAT